LQLSDQSGEGQAGLGIERVQAAEFEEGSLGRPILDVGAASDLNLNEL